MFPANTREITNDAAKNIGILYVSALAINTTFHKMKLIRRKQDLIHLLVFEKFLK